jgi:hypothetical protein
LVSLETTGGDPSLLPFMRVFAESLTSSPAPSLYKSPPTPDLPYAGQGHATPLGSNELHPFPSTPLRKPRKLLTMPPAPTNATNSNNSSQLDLADPKRGTSSSSSSGSKDKDTVTSGTRLQRFKETWNYDPFNQPDSIKRYEEWRRRAREERKVKLRTMVHETTDRARGIVGLGSKRRNGQEDIVQVQ